MDLSISATPRLKRGRPVGTGIDDRARLARIEALMFSEPYLTAAAAMRRLGIDGESAVRRLRGKLKQKNPVLLKRYHPTRLRIG